MKEAVSSESHSILKSTALSLAPGLLILAFFILVAPWATRHGFPAGFTIFIAIPLVLVPSELGYLLLQGKKLNGHYSLKGIVLFRDRIPLWQFFLFIPLLLVWCVFCFGVLSSKLDPILLDSLFKWMPGWFFVGDLSHYSRTVLFIAVVLGFIFNGFLGPVVEEMYFRGFLLPRLGHIGVWGPLLNVVLFSLYHFFSPWQNLTRIIALLPYVYAVWWKRNIYIGIFTHCALNIIGMVMLLLAILKM
jgi:CAAX protease family protein